MYVPHDLAMKHAMGQDNGDTGQQWSESEGKSSVRDSLPPSTLDLLLSLYSTKLVIRLSQATRLLLHLRMFVVSKNNDART